MAFGGHFVRSGGRCVGHIGRRNAAIGRIWFWYRVRRWRQLALRCVVSHRAIRVPVDLRETHAFVVLLWRRAEAASRDELSFGGLRVSQRPLYRVRLDL